MDDLKHSWEKALKDPEFQKVHEANQPKSDMIDKVWDTREDKGWTVEKLSFISGIPVHAIDEFDAGWYNEEKTLRIGNILLNAMNRKINVRSVRFKKKNISNNVQRIYG